MNENLRRARVEKAARNLDNPRLQWQVRADFGANGVMVLPFSTHAGASAVANYINREGRERALTLVGRL